MEHLPSLRECFFLFLVVQTVLTVNPRYSEQWPQQEEEQPLTYREGKIFSRNFWDGFEKGIRNTADMLHRVSENIEVAVDQLSGTDLIDGFGDMADRLEDRVEQSLPPFLRNPNLALRPNPSEIDAVTGTITEDFIDDGLKVYFDHDVAPSEIVPFTDGRVPMVEESAVPATTDHHFNFGFEGSLFRPFPNFGPFGPRPGGGNGLNVFNIFRRRQWWNGPNVCVDREETDEAEDAEDKTDDQTDAVAENEQTPVPNLMFGIGHMQFSSCQETSTKYSCVSSTNRRGISKTVKVTHRCCHGFTRDSSGCTKVELTELPATLENVGASDFLTLIKAAELIDVLDLANLTLFAPNDEAVQEFMADLEENNEIQNNLSEVETEEFQEEGKEIKDLGPTLLSHITNGFIYAGDLTDEQVIKSESTGSSLRINTYSSLPPTITVNCARILTANQHSINGVIHTTDRVLRPVTKSIVDLISTDPQFSILKHLVNQADILNQLQEATQLTLFAPTDSAFKNLPASLLDGLMEGTYCLKAVLMNHILPNTICSAAITSKARSLNMLDEFLIIERDDEEKMTVGDAHITTRDVVTTNGVMHIVDKVLIPQEAKSVINVLEDHNLTRFLDLIEMAGLRNELNGFVDVTVFAPTNAAFDEITEEELAELQGDKERLREIILHHVSASALQGRDINNNHITTTKASQPLRINLYSKMPLLTILRTDSQRSVRVTAGCSKVSVLDARACGAVVHVIERMLDIPEVNVLRQLENEDTHSMFLQMIKDSGLANELANSGPYTVLAPSNYALRTLPEEELKEIMATAELKKQIVKRHILYENICCSGINTNNWIFMDKKRAMDSSQVHVRRAPNGRLMADRARITKCGAPAQNGIVHTVNRLIIDPVSEEQVQNNNRRHTIYRPRIPLFGF